MGIEISLPRLGPESVEQTSGLSRLHMAILSKDPASVKRLLRSGTNKEAVSRLGQGKVVCYLTPLHLAVLLNQGSIVKFLLQGGTNKEAVAKGELEGGTVLCTALHIAVGYNFSEITQILLKAGCNRDALAKATIGPLKLFCTPVHLAAGNGQVNLLQMLLNAGCNQEYLANIEVTGGSGKCTPLHIAVRENQVAAVTFLLNAGCNKEARAKISCDGQIYSCTSVHLAAEEGHHQVLEVLLEAGCDMKKMSQSGNAGGVNLGTPLHVAVKKGHIECVKVLVHHGNFTSPTEKLEYIQLQDTNFMTSVVLAKLFDFPEIFSFLIKWEKDLQEPLSEEGDSSSMLKYLPHQLQTYRLNVFEPFAYGAYGEVFHATQGKDGPLVVLKKIAWDVEHTALDFNPKSEIAIAKSLKVHKNIVKILDSFTQTKTIWIVVEFCELGDLEAYCRKVVPPLDGRLELMTQATCGLMYLHAQRPPIVHRDLKLRNILVTREAGNITAKLTDFGSARQQDQSVMSTLCGTQTFWAPECLPHNGKIVYRKEVDIFSLGMVYLVMMQFKKDSIKFEPQMAGEANGQDTIAWIMYQAVQSGKKVPDVVKEHSWDHELVCKVKRLIAAMTRYQARDRKALSDVYLVVQSVNQSGHRMALLSTQRLSDLRQQSRHEFTPRRPKYDKMFSDICHKDTSI